MAINASFDKFVLDPLMKLNFPIPKSWLEPGFLMITELGGVKYFTGSNICIDASVQA